MEGTVLGEHSLDFIKERLVSLRIELFDVINIDKTLVFFCDWAHGIIKAVSWGLTVYLQIYALAVYRPQFNEIFSRKMLAEGLFTKWALLSNISPNKTFVPFAGTANKVSCFTGFPFLEFLTFATGIANAFHVRVTFHLALMPRMQKNSQLTIRILI